MKETTIHIVEWLAIGIIGIAEAIFTFMIGTGLWRVVSGFLSVLMTFWFLAPFVLWKLHRGLKD